MKLVFFGTPEFAIPSLEAIHDSKHELTGVVTMPDKKSGRGLKVQSSPVKKVAEKLGYPILQPIKLKDKNFVNKIKQFQTTDFSKQSNHASKHDFMFMEKR